MTIDYRPCIAACLVALFATGAFAAESTPIRNASNSNALQQLEQSAGADARVAAQPAAAAQPMPRRTICKLEDYGADPNANVTAVGTMELPTSAAAPAVIFTSAEKGVEVLYGTGSTRVISRQTDDGAPDVAVQIVDIRTIGDKKTAALFAIDRDVSKYNFNALVGDRTFNFACETEGGPTPVTAGFPREEVERLRNENRGLGCRYARLADDGTVRHAILSDVPQQHFNVHGDGYYGFMMSDGFIELSNTLYSKATYASWGHNRGVQFARYDASVAADPTAIPQTPRLRLSAECRKPASRVPVVSRTFELKKASGTDPARSASFTIQLPAVEGRTPYRLQLEIWQNPSRKNRSRLILASGKALEPNLIAYGNLDSTEDALIAADLDAADLRETMEFQVATCESGACRPIADDGIRVMSAAAFYR